MPRVTVTIEWDKPEEEIWLAPDNIRYALQRVCPNTQFQVSNVVNQPDFIQYEHHGKVVWVDRRLQGLHRSHCLCFKCEKFFPGLPNNCPIAQATFENCVKFNTTTPVYECPEFSEQKKVEPIRG